MNQSAPLSFVSVPFPASPPGRRSRLEPAGGAGAALPSTNAFVASPQPIGVDHGSADHPQGERTAGRREPAGVRRRRRRSRATRRCWRTAVASRGEDRRRRPGPLPGHGRSRTRSRRRARARSGRRARCPGWRSRRTRPTRSCRRSGPPRERAVDGGHATTAARATAPSCGRAAGPLARHRATTRTSAVFAARRTRCMRDLPAGSSGRRHQAIDSRRPSTRTKPRLHRHVSARSTRRSVTLIGVHRLRWPATTDRRSTAHTRPNQERPWLAPRGPHRADARRRYRRRAVDGHDRRRRRRDDRRGTSRVDDRRDPPADPSTQGRGLGWAFREAFRPGRRPQRRASAADAPPARGPSWCPILLTIASVGAVHDRSAGGTQRHPLGHRDVPLPVLHRDPGDRRRVHRRLPGAARQLAARRLVGLFSAACYSFLVLGGFIRRRTHAAQRRWPSDVVLAAFSLSPIARCAASPRPRPGTDAS